MRHKIRLSSLYNRLIFFLLFYCAIQDFFIPVVYKVTGSSAIANFLFYQKDVLLIVLFAWSLKRVSDKILRIGSLIYLMLVFVLLKLSAIGAFSVDTSLTSLLSNTRMVILLPCLVCIGSAIKDRDGFLETLRNKWFPFIVFMAIIGLIEYALDFLVGTKSFWTDTIGYTNYYVDIKKQASHMLFGLPGNFYGNYGNGYFSSKRLVGLWANPLTSAYSLLPCGIYYFIKVAKVFGRKIEKADIKNFVRFLIVFMAIYYTHTRAILISLLLIIAIYIFTNVRRSPGLLAIMIIGGLGAVLALDYNEIQQFMVDGSTLAHIGAVTQTMDMLRISLFGHGIGSLGVNAALTTESSYLTLLGNVGIIGTLLYLTIYLRGMRLAKYSRESDIGKLIRYCSFVYLITGFISEQLFAYTSIAQFFVLLGLSAQMSRAAERETVIQDIKSEIPYGMKLVRR